MQRTDRMIELYGADAMAGSFLTGITKHPILGNFPSRWKMNTLYGRYLVCFCLPGPTPVKKRDYSYQTRESHTQANKGFCLYAARGKP